MRTGRGRVHSPTPRHICRRVGIQCPATPRTACTDGVSSSRHPGSATARQLRTLGVMQRMAERRGCLGPRSAASWRGQCAGLMAGAAI